MAPIAVGNSVPQQYFTKDEPMNAIHRSNGVVLSRLTIYLTCMSTLLANVDRCLLGERSNSFRCAMVPKVGGASLMRTVTWSEVPQLANCSLDVVVFPLCSHGYCKGVFDKEQYMRIGYLHNY